MPFPNVIVNENTQSHLCLYLHSYQTSHLCRIYTLNLTMPNKMHLKNVQLVEGIQSELYTSLRDCVIIPFLFRSVSISPCSSRLCYLLMTRYIKLLHPNFTIYILNVRPGSMLTCALYYVFDHFYHFENIFIR